MVSSLEYADRAPIRRANQTPLAEYALIGDCRTAALVSRNGTIDWLCFPAFSGPAVFAALLDPEAGRFAITPPEPFRTSRRYAGQSPVIETSFTTAHGTARLRDCMVIMDGVSSLRPMRELVRVVEPIAGEVTFEIEIAVRPDFRRGHARLRRHGDIGWAILFGHEIIFVQSTAALHADGDVLRGTIRSVQGAEHRISLSYCKGDIVVIPPLGEAAARAGETADWWTQWSSGCRYDGPYREAVLRSAITLKQMIYCLSGAVVAAPTTSLPETIGEDDTYDYRFCWLRDAGFVVEALTSLGFQQDAANYLAWLLHSTRLTWPRLRVLYDVHGRDASHETVLPQFAGYLDSKPVRLGNQAGSQFQLDVYGHVIHAAERYAAAGGEIGPVEARMLRGLGRAVCREWQKPDNGVWEIRGQRRQYTFSKLMCWVALDRLLRLHHGGHVRLKSLGRQFTETRDEIAAAIESRGFSTNLHSYVADFDSEKMDASLLLMPKLEYLDASDPRFRGTLECMMERLCRQGLVYRYEPGYGAKDYQENSFGICSFWAVEALAAQNRFEEAKQMFATVLSCANDVLLMSEEIDPENRQLTGNFPQGFTHVGLIHAALALAKTGEARR